MNITLLASTEKNNWLHDMYPDSIVLSGHQSNKVVLGNRRNRVCRFCKKDSKATTFDMEAHLMPEFMGNKTLFSWFECDKCNSLFSKYETEFSNYFGIHHTMTRIKGKNGIPKFKDNRGPFEIEPDASALNLRAVPDDVVTVDENAKMLHIKTIRPTYVARHIFKCLVKIGYCLIPEETLDAYEVVRKWLINEVDESCYPSHPLFTIFYNIGGGLHTKHPFVAFFKKKPKLQVPENCVMLSYSHLKFQFFMPFHPNDNFLWNTEVKLPIEEHIVRMNDDGKTCQIWQKECSSMNKISGEEFRFSVGFEGEKVSNNEG